LVIAFRKKLKKRYPFYPTGIAFSLIAKPVNNIKALFYCRAIKNYTYFHLRPFIFSNSKSLPGFKGFYYQKAAIPPFFPFCENNRH